MKLKRRFKNTVRVIAATLITALVIQVFPMQTFAANSNLHDVDDVPKQDVIVTADYTPVLENNYNSYTMDAGRCGTFSIDASNRKLSLSRTDMSFEGNRMSASIPWLYSGGNWFFGYCQAIAPTKNILNKLDGYKMYDIGNSINFKKRLADENGMQVWQSDDTPNATLHINANGSYVINEKTRLDFNSAGQITKITNLEINDSVQIAYKADGNYDKVIDAVGREYRFAYSTINGILSVSSISAYNNNGNIIKVGGVNSTVLYNYQKVGDKNLVNSVTYPDGKSAKYQYNEKGEIISANEVNKNITITYDSGEVTKISDGAKWLEIEKDSLEILMNEYKKETYVYNFINEYGDTDRLFSNGNEFKLVYDKDWNTVFNSGSNMISNSLLYDYANWDIKNVDDGPLLIESWENYEALQYLSNGGVDFPENGIDHLSQKVKSTVRDGAFYFLGVVCSDVYEESTLGFFPNCNEYEETLYGYDRENNNCVTIPITRTGLSAVVFEAKEDVSDFLVALEGSVAVKQVFMTRFYTTIGNPPKEPEPEKEITSCPCPECEEIDCTCRCKNTTVCQCTQCISPVIKTKDSYGNLLTATRSADGKTMKQTNTYSANGDTLTSSTDENGVKINYNYDKDNGLLNSKSNQNGTTNRFTYDALGALKQIELQNSNGEVLSNKYTYSNDKLSSIQRNGFAYNFNYDNYGKLLNTKVNNNTLASYTYVGENVKQITFANGQTISYRIINNKVYGIDMNNDGKMEYTYTYTDLYNDLDTVFDHVNNTKTVFRNDTSVTSSMDGKQILYMATYDESIKETTETVNGEKLKLKGNTVGENGIIKESLSMSNDNLRLSILNTTDTLKRLSTKKISLNESNTSLTNSYGYTTNSSGLTGSLPNSLTQKITTVTGEERTVGFGCERDSVGNIISEMKMNNNFQISTKTFAYDLANQLISEEQNNQKIEYTYDVGGNIKEKHITSPVKDETISYGYDSQWKDLLVNYNGSAISRDDLGNVTNDSIWNYQWQSGRQLESMENETTNISYKYNIDGLRTYKSVFNAPDDITEYNYIWANKLLVGMEVSDTSGLKNTLRFLYEAGSPIGFILNETTPYLYEKNLSGDICGIIDQNGATVASYEYDAWGNELTASGDNTILSLNPFTYRGYQFDRETGLYYLQSRYFNPQWCQFINADTNLDTQTSIIGTNIFAYCDNNPVMGVDPTGCAPANAYSSLERLYMLLSTFLDSSWYSGEITKTDLTINKFFMTAAIASALVAIINATIALVIGYALTFLSNVSLITAGIIELTKGKIGAAASAGVLAALDFKIFDKINLFSNIIDNAYYFYGTFLVTETLTSPNGGSAPIMFLHTFNFIYGPYGTSLDTYTHERKRVF